MNIHVPVPCKGKLNNKVPVPVPCKGEVLVRVRAASINPGDWKVQSGLIPFLPRRFPATAGYDLAGNVVAVGPGVTKYSVGDAVFGRAPFFKMGALAQYAILETAGSAHKPYSLTFESAAALPVGLTALEAVRDGAGLLLPASPEEPKPGKQLFASSTTSPSPVISLSAPAAAQVASSADPPIAGLYDAVIDCSPNSLAVSAVDRVLRPQGRWVHVELPLSLLALGLWRRLALRPKKLYPVLMVNGEGDLEVVGRMAEEGKVKVVVESSVAFEEAREAWRSMGGHVTGKVVVKMGVKGFLYWYDDYS
ncbi:unnamed protein product [Closterium sp. Naga37s-1]|nr:unnamed protein product [Closterium sp. Naga37s-1]